ncbi:hypothetical protein NMA52_01355 [Lewinella sp. JB7]|nr:hypothetical protein [Lewinella sp. JB7]MCP9234571.1 hypothetical protein [Lewinella sp. JB7]
MHNLPLSLLWLCLVLSAPTGAQTVVLFYDWENTDPKVAAIGPNATSIGANVVTKTRVDGNTRGLAAGAGANKADIVMQIPSVAQFNVSGIDISFDYQRDETTATIFKRGNFVMGENGMNIKYRVTQAGGACSAVISSPNFTIPNDDVYRNYRFTYDVTSGAGTLYQNSTVLWSNTGTETPGQELCWTGDNEIVIGTLMDGSGTGNALMDNLLLQEPASGSGLPIELTHFAATPQAGRVQLSWTTATETDNDFFVVERSGNGTHWESIARIAGAGTSTATTRYVHTDHHPLAGTSFYRIKQVDLGQTFSYSPIETIEGGEHPCRCPGRLPQPDERRIPGSRTGNHGAAPDLQSRRPARIRQQSDKLRLLPAVPGGSDRATGWPVPHSDRDGRGVRTQTVVAAAGWSTTGRRLFREGGR